ncbi:MAG: hypothetical protein RIB60_08770 [Phycisphaerales bacterium]
MRDISPERVRYRLTRMRDRIDEAIAALDDGQPVHEVLRGVMQDHERLARVGEPRREAGRERPVDDEPIDVEMAEALVAKHLPELHARLTDPDAAMPGLRSAAMQRIASRVRHVLAETEDDPELRVLKLTELQAGADVFDAVRRYREASRLGDSARTSAREALVAVIGAQFDARHAVARAELERLERRVDRMRADIERMDERRSAEIERMLERVDRAPERRERRRPTAPALGDG